MFPAVCLKFYTRKCFGRIMWREFQQSMWIICDQVISLKLCLQMFYFFYFWFQDLLCDDERLRYAKWRNSLSNSLYRIFLYFLVSLGFMRHSLFVIKFPFNKDRKLKVIVFCCNSLTFHMFDVLANLWIFLRIFITHLWNLFSYTDIQCMV